MPAGPRALPSTADRCCLSCGPRIGLVPSVVSWPTCPILVHRSSVTQSLLTTRQEQCLVGALGSACSQHGSRTALGGDCSELSFRALWEHAGILATQRVEASAVEGEPVLVRCSFARAQTACRAFMAPAGIGGVMRPSKIRHRRLGRPLHRISAGVVPSLAAAGRPRVTRRQSRLLARKPRFTGATRQRCRTRIHSTPASSCSP